MFKLFLNMFINDYFMLTAILFFYFLIITIVIFPVTVCNQFSRGVFSMLGAVSPDSFDTLHSYSNTFQMPFVTPWFPEKVNKSYFLFLDLLLRKFASLYIVLYFLLFNPYDI